MYTRINSLEKFRGNAWLDVTYSVAGGVECGGWTCQVNTFMDIGGKLVVTPRDYPGNFSN